MPARSPRDRLRDLVVTALQERIWVRDGLPVHNRARSLVGLSPLRSYVAQYDAADRVLVLTSQLFDFPAKRLAPNVRYVGTPFDDAGVPATTWTPPWPAADGRARVLVSLSTLAQGQAPVLHRVLAALATLPVHAVVTTGPALDPAAFPVPSNVHLETFVPHAAVLPHMTAMITQCGLGGRGEASSLRLAPTAAGTAAAGATPLATCRRGMLLVSGGHQTPLPTTQEVPA